MPTYHVTVKAFGQISARKIDADTRKEAEEKALEQIGFSVESKLVTTK